MMRSNSCTWHLLSAMLAISAPSYALETPPIGSQPARIDVTESSSVLYNFDNRNSRGGSIPTEVDDNWGTWYNRLNTNASWGSFQANLRLDSAWFYTSRSPSEVALGLLERRNGGPLSAYSAADGQAFVRDFRAAGEELSTRAVSWLYPAKYSLSYVHPNVEVTVGDNYAQFGRGLVLNLRKQDELASDTTLRGGRVTTRAQFGESRIKFTALGGTANPLRIDEASGRFLGTTSAVLDGVSSVTEAGMPRAIENDFVPTARPNFIPDGLYGAELEARRRSFAIAASVAHLARGCSTQGAGTDAAQCGALASDAARAYGTMNNASLAFELPTLPYAGALYVEYAHQWRADPRVSGLRPAEGGALYASLSLNPEPVSFTGEFKHTRSFLPLAANIDVTRAREFTPVQYSAPPTTEPVWNDTEFEHFATCVTGGRGRADVHLSRATTVFAWVGRYDTWGELSSTCAPSEETLNRVWDFAHGVDAATKDRSSRGNLTLGLRFDTAARPFATPNGIQTDLYYRELYVRYDFAQRLTPELSLELQGWHRRRHQSLGPEEPWLQGTTETGLHLGTEWTAVFGFEYDERPGVPGTYLNGQLRYALSTASNLALFVGQRMGGQRCVSGVCRVFPPFEGARLDATFRF